MLFVDDENQIILLLSFVSSSWENDMTIISLDSEVAPFKINVLLLLLLL